MLGKSVSFCSLLFFEQQQAADKDCLRSECKKNIGAKTVGYIFVSVCLAVYKLWTYLLI
jgi:hypothetical protein